MNRCIDDPSRIPFIHSFIRGASIHDERRRITALERTHPSTSTSTASSSPPTRFASSLVVVVAPLVASLSRASDTARRVSAPRARPSIEFLVTYLVIYTHTPIRTECPIIATLYDPPRVRAPTPVFTPITRPSRAHLDRRLHVDVLTDDGRRRLVAIASSSSRRRRVVVVASSSSRRRARLETPSRSSLRVHRLVVRSRRERDVVESRPSASRARKVSGRPARGFDEDARSPIVYTRRRRPGRR